MKLTTSQLRQIIKEELNDINSVTNDSQRFLHGYEENHPHDDEGYMLKSNLYSMKQMAEEVCEIVQSDDQLPGWVQELLAVSHENLSHVHRYLTGDEALRKYSQQPQMKESKLNESHNRITKEEMDAWMRGDWGFVSEGGTMKTYDNNTDWVNAVYSDDRTIGQLLNAHDDMSKTPIRGYDVSVSSSAFQDLLPYEDLKINNLQDPKINERVKELVSDLISLAAAIDEDMM